VKKSAANHIARTHSNSIPELLGPRLAHSPLAECSNQIDLGLEPGTDKVPRQVGLYTGIDSIAVLTRKIPCSLLSTVSDAKLGAEGLTRGWPGGLVASYNQKHTRRRLRFREHLRAHRLLSLRQNCGK
jgi:hypothetical protein